MGFLSFENYDTSIISDDVTTTSTTIATTTTISKTSTGLKIAFSGKFCTQANHSLIS